MIAALLRGYHKAQDWIAKNPVEAVKLVTEKKYVNIEDIDLAIKLVRSYKYPTAGDYASGRQDVKADVLHFATALHKIGYLQTAPEKYVEKAYAAIDLTQK